MQRALADRGPPPLPRAAPAAATASAATPCRALPPPAAMVDFVGQKLSEDIYTYVITGASVVAFLAGYATACAPRPRAPALRRATPLSGHRCACASDDAAGVVVLHALRVRHAVCVSRAESIAPRCRRSFQLMMQIFGAGVAVSLLLCVPPWPFLRRNPLTWLPKKGEAGAAPQGGAAKRAAKGAKRN